MDSIRERVRQAMEWLKDNRLFNSNRAIAEKMGYNPSVVSQVITGKSNVSERFVKSLCSIYPYLSFDWIWSGNGSMIQETAARQQESDPEPPQFDRFSYILADMAEIIKNYCCPIKLEDGKRHGSNADFMAFESFFSFYKPPSIKKRW